MEEDKRKDRIKLAAQRAIENDSQNKIIINVRQQQKCANKQPAQERLKRLQSNLKQLRDTKLDKERSLLKRSSRSFSTISPSKSQQQATATFHTTRKSNCALAETSKQPKGFFQSLKDFCFPEKLKPVQPSSSSSQINEGSSTRRISVKNAWAKPKALLDASNRQERKSSISANQRLMLLRESLQQQQQLKETNNNTKIKKNDDPTAPKIAKLNYSPAYDKVNDDEEPMDIDWQEDQVKECSTSGSNAVRPSQSNFQQEEKSHVTLMKLLETGEELPARCVDHMYFVLDTNVLMDNLMFVEDLCQVALGKTNGSMLYLPYIVIKELDKLKDRRNDNEHKRTTAMRAIRYLNKKFDNSLKIQGQSALEEADHLIEVDCPDDSIVNCCLQLKSQVPHLMLLTNDNNLRLKANASAIQVSCRSDLLNDYREEFDALPS